MKAYKQPNMSVIRMPSAPPKLRRTDRDIGTEFRELLSRNRISLDAAAKAFGLKGASSTQNYTKAGRYKLLPVSGVKKLAEHHLANKPEEAAILFSLAGISATASAPPPNKSIAAQIDDIERSLDQAEARINHLRKLLRGG